MKSGMTSRAACALVATAACAIGWTSEIKSTPPSVQETKGQYAQVNGLKMYYEIHGEGRPLVLLHGAFGTVEAWGPILPTLAKSRKVIVIEQQGHGRTADIDRPLSYRQMAEDTAALLRQIGVKNADVFGYSMGGATAFQLAIKHPDLVRKLAVLGAGTGAIKDVFEPEAFKQFKSITPENFNYPEVKDPYTRVAPDPLKWPVLVSKIVKMADDPKGIPSKDVKSIKAPTLIMLGDRDGIKIEHVVEVFRMIPNSQLAIFPGGDHFLPFTSVDKVVAVLSEFLDASAPSAQGVSK